jgi:transaldolase
VIHLLYLDSALASDAATATDLGFVAGVTTNPKLMAAAVEPPVVTLAELCDRGPGVVFYQVTADDVAGREKEAHDVHTVRPGRVGIKIPCTVENLAMAVRLRRDGIGPIGITAVFTPAQAVLAAAVGADFVLPYVNRLTRLTGDGLAVVAGMARVLRGSSTEILAASVKTAEEAVQTLQAGAQHLTLALGLIEAMGESTHSHAAIEEFAQAIR